MLTPPHSQLTKQQSTLSEVTDSAVNNRQGESSHASGSDKSAVKPKKISIQDLTESEKEDTMAQFEDNIDNMIYEFAHLLSRTRNSMEGRVSPKELAVCVLDLKAFSGKEDAALKEHEEELINAKDVQDVFLILNSYWCFLDYHVLSFIIEIHGSKEDKINLENYDQKLKGLCWDHVFEVPQQHEYPKQTELCFKLDQTSDGLNSKGLRRIKRKLAKILNVMPSTLLLCSIEKGCVQLTILIPNFVAQEIFPLSEDQELQLSNASVLRLERDHYVEFQEYIILLAFTSISTLGCRIRQCPLEIGSV